MPHPPKKRYKSYLDKDSVSREVPRSTSFGRVARTKAAAASHSTQHNSDNLLPRASILGNSPPAALSLSNSLSCLVMSHTENLPNNSNNCTSPPRSCSSFDSSPSSDDSDNEDSPSDNDNEWRGLSPDEHSEENSEPEDEPLPAENPPVDENPPPVENPPPDDPPPVDPYNLNQHAEPNVRLTKFEILVMMTHFAIRFGLSDQGIIALIKMINEILGDRIIPPTMYFFNKIFASNFQKSIYLYCSKCLLYLGEKEECADIEVCPAPNCHEPVEAKTSNKGHFFTTISIEDQIREKLLTDGEALLSYRQNRIHNDREIRDVFDTINFQDLDGKVSADNADSSFVTLNASTDGGEVFENSLSSMWPIQFFLNEVTPTERFAPYNVLLAGVWFGKTAPSMTTYFTALIAELQKLATDGITWFRNALQRQEVTKVFCLNCSLDTPAKAKVMNMVQFNGRSSCYFCLHEGDQLPENDQIRYGYREIYERRPEASLRENMVAARDTGEIVNGVKGMSPLYYFPNFSLPWGVVIDVMHSHLLGVPKYLCMNIWTNPEHSESDFYLTPAKVNIIDRRIRHQHRPSNISRDLRPLSTCANWKASEWRSWLFYYGPVCLRGLLPQRYFKHFCKLSAGIYFFSQSSIDRYQVAHYGGLLSSFVKEFQQYYGLRHMTYSVHLTEHIKECVTTNGPLWCYSIEPFETGMRFIADLVKGAKCPQLQITRRFCCLSSVSNVAKSYPPLNATVVSFCDSILPVRRVKFIGHCGEDMTIIGNKFRSKFVPSVAQANSLAQALPGILDHDLYAINKILFRRRIYESRSLKEKRIDDSYLRLSDGRVLQVIQFFISSMDVNQLYMLGKRLSLRPNERAVFSLDHFHVRICSQYRFEDGFVVAPATMIQEKCFFLSLQGDLSYVAHFPNISDRD